jgi:hypothetical protein
MEVIYLSNYDIVYLGKKAEELGFVRDTLEKVTRLGTDQGASVLHWYKPLMKITI